MTQSSSAQEAGKTLASRKHASTRTLAAWRSDFEAQMRSAVAANATMALTDPTQVRKRMKDLRDRTGPPAVNAHGEQQRR